MKRLSMENINDACLKIAERIKADKHNIIYLAAVSRGGLVPATIVAHYLGVKNLFFIRLSSYSDAERNQSDIIDSTTDVVPDGANTYIIDDICDSGKTLQYLRKHYPNSKVMTVVNKNPSILPDFASITEPLGLWINFPWEVED